MDIYDPYEQYLITSYRSPYRQAFYRNSEHSFLTALGAFRTGLTPFNDLHHSHLTQNYWDKQFKDVRRLYYWDTLERLYVPSYYNRFSRNVSHYRP